MQDQGRWQWLKASELKRETETIICASQEQALRTNAIKNGIDHQDVFPLYRLCKLKASPMCYFVFCPRWKPIQEDARETWKKVHWLMCKKIEIECEYKWFSYQPEPVLENDKSKILWDFEIQTDKDIEH